MQTSYKRVVGWSCSALVITALVLKLAAIYMPPVVKTYAHLGPTWTAVLSVAVAGVSALGQLARRRKSAWEAELDGSRRKLWGLFPLPAPPPAAAPAVGGAPAQGRSTTPIKPPQRSLPLTGQTPATPSPAPTPPPHLQSDNQPWSAGRSSASGQSPYQAPSPLSAPWQRKQSRYSTGRVVTTPEQLKRYTDEFGRTSASPGEQGYSPGFAGDQGVSSMQQPYMIGAPAPHYQPSLLPKGRVLALQTDRGLQPSPPEALDDVLRDLKMDRRTLEVWTERFREWLSAEVFKPLQRLLHHVHEEVNAAFAQLNWVPVSFGSLVPSHSSSGSVAAVDEVQLSSELRGQVQRMLTSSGLPPQKQQEAANCLLALHRYQHLAALISGEEPRNLLQPAGQRRYLAQRIEELAQGTCVREFAWNSGGSFDGRPWSAELPSDADLVFYLVAAYMESPGWKFMLDEPHLAVSIGGPLYTGHLPTKLPEEYCAMLPFRPTPEQKARGALAMLGTSLGSQQPLFTMLVRGDATLSLCHYDGVFWVTLLLMRYAQLNYRGHFGGRSLDLLRLSGVLKPADPFFAGLFMRPLLSLW